jgi:hypothetical protein
MNEKTTFRARFIGPGAVVDSEGYRREAPFEGEFPIHYSEMHAHLFEIAEDKPTKTKAATRKPRKKTAKKRR